MYGRGYQRAGVSFGPPVTPPVIKQLLMANIIVFLLQPIVGGITAYGAVTPVLFWNQGYIWQPFTYMFLHANFMHLAGNMFTLWMFGTSVALAWGPKRFLRFYLLSGLGAGLVIATIPYISSSITDNLRVLGIPTLGASGAVFAVLLAYALTWPDRTIMLIFPPIPLKAIWLIPLLLVMEFSSGYGSNISHTGHLGGVAVGWILYQRGSGGRIFPSYKQLLHKWNRFKMRRQFRELQREENDWRKRH